MLGDLHEEFARRARTQLTGARVRYVLDALGIAVRYFWVRRDWIIGRDAMDRMWTTVRYAGRRLLKSPFFTAVAVASLALGIGANTAIFSVVNAVALRDLPFEDPASLVDVYISAPGFSHAPLSYLDEQDLQRDATEVFADVACSGLTLVPTDVEGGVEMVPAEGVTGNYFPMTGVRAVVGRLFTNEEQVALGAHRVVVLGYGYWQRRYAGDPNVVGRDIRLAGRAYMVIGVVQPQYTGQVRGFAPDLYFPILQYEDLQQGTGVLDRRGNHGLFTKARLAPGVTLARAEAVLTQLAADYKERYPGDWGPIEGFALVPTADVVVNPMIDRVLVRALAVVMVVVGLVLLIACANLASFLLARATDRRKEIAVRLALGARRRALVGQLLTETTLLALLGGVAGIVLAAWSLRALSSVDVQIGFPITLDLSMDGSVLVFTLLVSLAAGVLFGLAPALQSTRPDIVSTLRDESAGGGRAKGTVLRNALVVVQVGVCVVLLTSAGLFLRSLAASSRVDPGFGYDPAAVVTFAPPEDRYDEDEARLYLERLEQQVATFPGVASVGLTGNLHLNPLSYTSARVNVDGVEPPPGQEHHQVDYTRVDAGFFDAAGIRFLAGRNFAATDEPDAEEVVVVNEAFARRFLGAASASPGDLQRALGQPIHLQDGDARVVGVVATVNIRQIGEEPRPFLYGNQRQTFTRFVTLVASTSGDAGGLSLEVMRAARAMDPDVMIAETSTMERHLAAMLLARRLGAGVVAGFAALALVLASIGLYGLVSYAVARRAHEVGIRLSLGADAGQVVRMLAGDGMRLVAIGGVAGLLISALLAQLLSRLLYGVPALDPITFLGVPLVLGAVALVATWIPARRASRMDPCEVLRGS